MCLLTRDNLPRLTIKPIKVYKVVRVNSDGFYGVFMHEHKFSEINTENIFPLSSLWCPGYYNHVNDGYIHSYLNRNHAELMSLSFDVPFNSTVIECIIPRFTFYFKGTNGDICSKKLIIPNYDEVFNSESYKLRNIK